MLIGSDVSKALEPQEVKRGKDGGPYVVRTLPGWTLNGPLGRQSCQPMKMIQWIESSDIILLVTVWRSASL